MWNPQVPTPVERRDRGLSRLRAWTTASVALAGALVVVFSVMAASSFPGRGQASPSATPPADDQAQAQQSSGDDGGGALFQPPSSGFFGGGGGGGQQRAVSGGS